MTAVNELLISFTTPKIAITHCTKSQRLSFFCFHINIITHQSKIIAGFIPKQRLVLYYNKPSFADEAYLSQTELLDKSHAVNGRPGRTECERARQYMGQQPAGKAMRVKRSVLL